MYNIRHAYKEEARNYPLLKAAFEKNFRVGIEIEGNIEEEEHECELTPQECGACDNCHVCNGCYDNEIYCGNCIDYESRGGNSCIHQEGAFCAYFERDICDMCIEEDVRCNRCDPCEDCDERYNNTNIDEIHDRIAVNLNCISGHTGYMKCAKYFQCVYNDGSVNTEIVTSAVKPKELKKVLRKGIKEITDEGGEVSPYARAGFHQTFSYKHTFPDIVCKNIIQLTRFYLPALLCISTVDGTYSRNEGTDYRAIPQSGLRIGKEIYNNKYTAVHTKQLENLPSPSLIEFRYPDATENINQTILTMLFNAALIMKAFDESEKGIIEMTQRHFMAVKQEVNSIYGTGAYFNYIGLKSLIFEMFNYLKPELSKIADIENIYHHLIDITNHHAGYMENQNDLKEVTIK